MMESVRSILLNELPTDIAYKSIFYDIRYVEAAYKQGEELLTKIITARKGEAFEVRTFYNKTTADNKRVTNVKYELSHRIKQAFEGACNPTVNISSYDDAQQLSANGEKDDKEWCSTLIAMKLRGTVETTLHRKVGDHYQLISHKSEERYGENESFGEDIFSKDTVGTQIPLKRQYDNRWRCNIM